MDKTSTSCIKTDASKRCDAHRKAVNPAPSTLAFIRQFARAYHVIECNSAPAFYGFVLN